MGIATQKSQGISGEINFGNSPLDRNGPSKEFEKEFLKTFDERGYKKKYGKEEKQNLLPPSYLRKRTRGGIQKERGGFKFKGLDRINTQSPSKGKAQQNQMTLGDLMANDQGGIYESEEPEPIADINIKPLNPHTQKQSNTNGLRIPQGDFTQSIGNKDRISNRPIPMPPSDSQQRQVNKDSSSSSSEDKSESKITEPLVQPNSLLQKLAREKQNKVYGT